MNSQNELLENYSFPKENKLFPKIEPIDVDFIKEEEYEEEEHFDNFVKKEEYEEKKEVFVNFVKEEKYEEKEEEIFVVPGIIESLKNEKVLNKEGYFENKGDQTSSSSNV